ncbi:MAG: cellulase family glycosylhydrolase [Bacilli bacterium]|nr:cellulase family glycosylhydrolase [Bacilli bacterium]
MDCRWPLDKINAWYNSTPWLRGSNFLPSNVVNRLDMYQTYKSDEHLAVAEEELKLHQSIGFNTVRLWVDFDCYFLEGEKYLKILEKYIALSAKYKQKVMLVLTHEEDLHYGDKFVAKKLGEQKRYYTHFNRDYQEYELHQKEKRHYIEYNSLRPLFIQMVHTIVNKYKDDSRIIAWNIYNEPGITINERSIPILEELFELVRSYHPLQPLTADIWRGINDDGSLFTKEEEKALELSDFISFHCYSGFNSFKRKIEALKKRSERPIVVTEWLQRCNHNNVEDIYPYLAQERIGCYCWGFVNGDTFTDEPWNSVWEEMKIGNPNNYDVTKWQHNLIRRNHEPYDPKEIEIITKINKDK